MNGACVRCKLRRAEGHYRARAAHGSAAGAADAAAAGVQLSAAAAAAATPLLPAASSSCCFRPGCSPNSSQWQISCRISFGCPLRAGAGVGGVPGRSRGKQDGWRRGAGSGPGKHRWLNMHGDLGRLLTWAPALAPTHPPAGSRCCCGSRWAGSGASRSALPAWASAARWLAPRARPASPLPAACKTASKQACTTTLTAPHLTAVSSPRRSSTTRAPRSQPWGGPYPP